MQHLFHWPWWTTVSYMPHCAWLHQLVIFWHWCDSIPFGVVPSATVKGVHCHFNAASMQYHNIKSHAVRASWWCFGHQHIGAQTGNVCFNLSLCRYGGVNYAAGLLCQSENIACGLLLWSIGLMQVLRKNAWLCVRQYVGQNYSSLLRRNPPSIWLIDCMTYLFIYVIGLWFSRFSSLFHIPHEAGKIS